MLELALVWELALVSGLVSVSELESAKEPVPARALAKDWSASHCWCGHGHRKPTQPGLLPKWPLLKVHA